MGYRIQAHLRAGRVRLTRAQGWIGQTGFRPLQRTWRAGRPGNLALDGKIVCAAPDGRPNFSGLQDNLKRGRHDRFVYYAFDLLHLDGHDTRPAPLIERKRVLQSLLAKAATSAPRVLHSEHFENGGEL
jgi:bifunctional non-homologous end joining protein LigD